MTPSKTLRRSVHLGYDDVADRTVYFPFIRVWDSYESDLAHRIYHEETKLYFLLYDLGNPPIHPDNFKQFLSGHTVYYQPLCLQPA